MTHKGCRASGLFNFVFLGIFLVLGFFSNTVPAQETARPSETTQFRKEIPYGENKLVLVSDHQERVGKKLYRATGNVVITFLDMILTCDEAEYDERTFRITTRGETWFRQKRVSLTGSSAVFDPDSQTVILYDVSGHFYDTSGRSEREFFLTGGMVQYIETDKLEISWNAMQKD